MKFQESILLWQRKCEDALYSLLILGARRPVRHLASVAMRLIISKGDGISIYSRASSLQGFLSDGKRNEPQKIAGLLQILVLIMFYSCVIVVVVAVASCFCSFFCFRIFFNHDACLKFSWFYKPILSL